MSATAILENVRRYRTIASLCRQTTLLEQAFEWERLAMTELETYVTPRRDGWLPQPRAIKSGMLKRRKQIETACGSSAASLDEQACSPVRASCCRSWSRYQGQNIGEREEAHRS